jgi:AcrR family transcriptional regulator
VNPADESQPPATLDPLLREALEAKQNEDGTAQDGTTQRILAGTLAMLQDFGLRRTTLEDVARRVRVSRATIYRRFASKDVLVRAVLLRELRRFFSAIDERVAGIDSTEDRIAEGFAFALQFLNEHALLNRFMRTEPELLLPYLTLNAGPVLEAAQEFLAERLEQEVEQGRLTPLDTQVAGELLARLVLSFFLTPNTVVPLSTPEDARRFARLYLAPALRTPAPSREPAP